MTNGHQSSVCFKLTLGIRAGDLLRHYAKAEMLHGFRCPNTQQATASAAKTLRVNRAIGKSGVDG